MVSSVKITMQLLHEEDLLNFIDDLSRRAKPYLSVRSCDVTREDPRRRRHDARPALAGDMHVRPDQH